MSNLDNIYYINIKWIDEEIDRLQMIKGKVNLIGISLVESSLNGKIMILKKLKNQLKPIKPLISDAFFEGICDSNVIDKENYLNNLIVK